MPKNNSGSVSFPGGDGEPVIIAKEDFVSEQHLPLGEPDPDDEPYTGEQEEGEQTSVGISSSESSRNKPSTNANSSKKTGSR